MTTNYEQGPLRAARELVSFLAGLRFSVLTGAGCSTESGIPDYRGPQTKHVTRNPIQYQAFVKSPSTRRRYWARAVVGWERFCRAEPNPAHRALSALEAAGLLRGLVTQNVDRLHRAAGSEDVIELHGALANVRCLDCGHIEARESVQDRLLALNPDWRRLRAEVAPDGDARVQPEEEARFVVAGCERCGGVLKPDVVFFGENVPRPRVESAYGKVEAADALLVVGSSLTVFSGYRFVRRAAERNIPVAIVNLGPTRGDPHAALRIDAPAGEILPQVAAALTRG